MNVHEVIANDIILLAEVGELSIRAIVLVLTVYHIAMLHSITKCQ